MFCIDEVGAMERLRFVLLFAAVVATAQTSRGQQMPAPASSGPSSAPTESRYFAVIGDVRNFNYYALSAGSRITVRDAVINAGLLSESVNVAVVRGTQDRAIFTQMISASSSDSGELVVHGDVLVVQAMQPLTGAAVQKAAALRVDSRVILIALADDTVALGDVLEQTGNLPIRDQQLKMAFRFQGSPLVSRPALADRVAHGDVISLTRGASTPKGFGRMSPAFSEWQSSALDAEPSAAADGLKFANNSAASNDLTPPSLQIPLSMPSGDASVLMEEPAEPQNEDLFPALRTEPGRTAGPNSVPVHSVSQVESETPGDYVARPTAEASAIDTAPVPPVEVPIAASTPGNDTMSAWNMVFIGGLMLAGTLILAGSLRSDDENTSEKLFQYEQGRAEAVSSSLPQSSVAPTAAAPATTLLRTKIRLSSIPAEPSNGETASAATTIPSLPLPEVRAENTGLVETHEWFGDDWRTVRSGARDSSIELVTSVVAPDMPGIVANPEARADMVETLMAAPGTCAPAIDDKVSVDTHKNEQSADGPLSELEDLLQNRLPIDLCETKLPLKIVLFGKAAGPRRLRIDAAHPTMAGPHINMTNDRKREEPVAVSASRVKTESSEGHAVRSLDRALQSLQNRTDS
jgi:hypothetical protein